MDQLSMGCTFPYCIGRFGIICLNRLCGFSILIVCQTNIYTYSSNYAEAQIAHKPYLWSHREYVLPSTVQASCFHALPGNVLSTAA